VLHCAVMFTVFSAFFLGGQNFRLSSLVGGVWVVFVITLSCGLLSLSFSCIDQVGVFCYNIYLLIAYLYIIL
jgi:hypothetical protein